MSQDLRFGWLSPVIGNQWSDHKPIVVYQEEHILPTAVEHFDSLWIADHFYGFDTKTDPFMEGWTTLTWLAAKFPDILLCHHVLGVGYRPAALTAKMAATLQVLSGNRFILGIGAGWRGPEYEAYGYEFPKPSVRFAQLDEMLQICKLMWTEDEPSFSGEHYHIDRAAAPPRPEVIPPICIGASGEKIGLPLAGRHGDIWNGIERGTDDDWRRKVDIVHGSATDAGRDPADIEISQTVEKALPESDTDSAELLDHLGHKVELGVRHFVMDFGNPATDEHIMRFVEQVMEPLKRQAKC
ncbi:MAG: LLM class flavin-dependent oxidoreductase [Actinomycetia bacterium]|nr:LLM class flavin-dependent oxidoreductase [Actinomycetes bacterium]MCP5035959.1 LLM class flavin-dependent oxidoreductase [Actinomycetes bacterium]